LKLNTVTGQLDDFSWLLINTFKAWQLQAITQLQIPFRRDQLLTKSNDMWEMYAPRSFLGIVLSQMRGSKGLQRVCLVLVGMGEWQGIKQRDLEGCRSSSGRDDVEFEAVEYQAPGDSVYIS
jgi:hypothetical protein